MSFFRALWKNGSKHKKLYDEWALAGAQDLEPEEQSEEVTFNLKYIGSTLVESAASEAATADAVKTTLNLAKAGGKKLPRVSLSVNLRGIKITNLATNEAILDMSIYRISYCSADATHSEVFAFISTNDNETLECHAFLCPKRKVAQTVSLTVAQMFNTAFENWQLTQDQIAFQRSRELARKSEKENIKSAQISPLRELGMNNKQESPSKDLLIDIDSCTPIRSQTNWVNFDSDSISNKSRFQINDNCNETVATGNFNDLFPNSWDQSVNLYS